MFGEGDINGQEPENVSVVAEMTFHSDMTLSYKGLVNDDNDAVIDYAIEDGKLAFYDDGDVDYSEIVCGSTPSYIKTHSTHDDTVHGAELLFYSKQAALDYAQTLTQDIPVCMNAAYNVIPTIEGEINWDEVDPMIVDEVGDAGLSAYDIVNVKMVQNTDYLFIQYQKAGDDWPVVNHYGNRWIHFRTPSGYAFAVEAFYFEDTIPAILYDISNDIEYGDYINIINALPTSEDSQVLTVQVPKANIDTSKVYEVDFFTHYSNLGDTWDGEDESENDRGRVNYVSFW
jgi:hypothetical protein